MANIKVTAREKEFVQSMEAMSGSVGRLAAKISVDLVRSYQQADRQQKLLNQGLVRFNNEMIQTGQSLSTHVSVPLSIASAAALKFYGDIQAIGKGLGVIEGSAPAAAKAMETIREIAKMPGLGLEEAAQGYTNLRAVGFEAEKAKQTIMQLGNALAISGKGKAEFSSIVSQIVQMSSKSKVLAEDLKPILNSAPIIAKILKDTMGTVDSEQISKILQDRGQSTAQFVDFLVAKLSELDRTSGGVKNSIENFGDSLKIGAANIGEIIDTSVGAASILDNLGQSFEDITEYLKTLNPETKALIVGMGGLAIVAGPVLATLGLMANSVLPLITSGFAALTGPLGLVATGLAIVGSGLAIYLQHTAKMQELATATMSVEEATKRANIQTQEQVDNVQRLLGVLQNEKSKQDEVKKAKEELIAISPKFQEALKGQEIDFAKLTDAASSYVTELNNIAKGQVLLDALEKNLALERALKLDPQSAATWWDKTKSVLAGAIKGGALGGQVVNAQGAIVSELIVDANTLKDRQMKELKDARKQINKEIAALGVSSTKPATTTNTGGGGNNPTVTQEVQNIKKALTQNTAFVTGGPSSDFGPFWDTYLSALFGEDKWDSKMKTSVAKLNEKIAAELKKLPQTYGEQAAQTLIEMQSQMANSLQMTGANFVEQLAAGIASGQGLEGAFAGLLGSVGDMVSRIGKEFLVIDKLLKFAKSVLGTAPGPGAAIALIAAGGILKGLASSAMQRNGIRAFAQGGIIQGPTLGLMGEYPGASSNPEVVAPLDKLKSLIKPQGGGDTNGFILSTSISGDELLIMLQRAERKRNG